MGTDEQQKLLRPDPANRVHPSGPTPIGSRVTSALPFLLTIIFTALILLLLFLLLLTFSGNGLSAEPETYGVEIEAGNTSGRSADPGNHASFDVTITNTGDVDDSFDLFILHGDPGRSAKSWAHVNGLPENSTGNASQGSTGTIAPGEWIYLDLIFEVPRFVHGDSLLLPGVYDLILLAQSQTNGSVIDQLRFNVTVNPVYSTEVSSDEFVGLHEEPGNDIEYMVKIRNTGNVNETYQIAVLGSGIPYLGDGKKWTVVEGLTPDNQVTIPVGETKYLPVTITIPEFTEENDEAEEGHYSVKIRAISTNWSNEDDELVFEFEVDELYRIRMWLDIPGKNGTIIENGPTEITYTLNVRNLGNTDDDIMVTVPIDFCCNGKMFGWTAKFGTQTSKLLTLHPLSQRSVTMTLTIDKDTDPGYYQLRVRAESQGDTSVYVYTTVYINLTKAEYGVKLEKFTTIRRRCNPSDESEIEFKFTLTNTGNQDDTYTVKVETPLESGVYKGWTMEFEDKDNERVDQLLIPTDLKGNTDLYLSKNSRVDLTLYVTVSPDEDEDEYGDIAVSATSNNDNSVVDYVYFNLTVILPNIRITDKDTEFSIEPDSGIEEDDSIDINVRIYNDGSAETDDFWVFFYNGRGESPTDLPGNYIALEKVENIPVGQYTDVLGTWNEIPAGENDIYVYADKPIKSGSGKTLINNQFSDDGLVLESKENDNTASIGDKYQQAIDLRPDLHVIDFYVDSTVTGKTTTATVAIENRGSALAKQGSAQVSLKIGGVPIESRFSEEINPFLPEDVDIGGRIEVDFRWEVPDEEGNFTVKASVDNWAVCPYDDSMIIYVRTEEPPSETLGQDGFGMLVGFCLLVVVLMVILSATFLRKRPRSPLNTARMKKEQKKTQRMKKTPVTHTIAGQNPDSQGEPNPHSPQGDETHEPRSHHTGH
jgi:uncharacterized membrane protein